MIENNSTWLAYLGKGLEHECEQDDLALIEAARLQPTAFGELYQRYLARIYRYVRLHTKSADDAADLTQQVFLQALAAMPRYQVRDVPFSAWLFRIARNVAINTSQRGHQTVDLSLVTDAWQQSVQAGKDNPESVMLRRESLLRLQELLRTLAPDKRELLALRFVAGLTVREIAPVVGKSEAAVHKQFTRILQNLKEQYMEYEGQSYEG